MSHPPPNIGISGTDTPGTVYLVDIHRTATEITHAGNKDILSVPQPLKTKHDPLNWPKYKKYWSLFLASLFACVMSFGENNLGAAWTTMNGGSAVNYLLLSFCNILWVPTAMKLGRKFCYIGAMTINMLALIWNTYFDGPGQWYGLCIVGGFGTAAYEAIIQLTIFDIFFAHERGTMLAVYVWGMQLGSILGLILGGYISDDVGWRWTCSISAILSGIVIALFIFTFDDSLFPRHIFRDQLPETALTTQQTLNLQDETMLVTHTEATTDGKRPTEKTATVPARTSSITEGTIDLPARTYLQLLNPIHTFAADHTRWIQYFVRPFILFLFPNVLIAGLIFAFGLQQAYSIGMATANVGDRIVLFLARRNGGYKEPEMRLWVLTIGAFYAGVRYFAYGWGAQEGAPWPVVAVGLGAMTAHQITATSVATACAMECFEGTAGELVVVLACCSSLINFAISESVQPFIDRVGYGWTFTFFGCCVLGSLVLAGGKYERFVQQDVGFGLG
ncbi:major facilitator superfamily domain-containing protein [Delphinella strobiligena]|nr:major facilitator superfamily domain-containing protein [Delphinella strobiligena]